VPELFRRHANWLVSARSGCSCPFFEILKCWKIGLLKTVFGATAASLPAAAQARTAANSPRGIAPGLRLSGSPIAKLARRGRKLQANVEGQEACSTVAAASAISVPRQSERWRGFCERWRAFGERLSLI
jgi:hypothetical protein